MDLKFNSSTLPVVVDDQQLLYAEGCESSGPLTVSLKLEASVRGDHEKEITTESYVEHSEIAEFSDFVNETTVAAVEEISDAEQKQEIELVIEEINNVGIELPEYERYCYKVRKGRRKRHWSDEWQTICSGPSGVHEQPVDKSVNSSTAHVVHRKPKKRLFAHRYMYGLNLLQW